MTDQPAAVSETPAFTPTEDPVVASEDQQIADLRASYAKAQGDDEAPKEADPAPQPAEDGPEKEAPLAEVIAAPSHLPEDIQALWKDIPDAARPALERSYRSLGDRLAQQGRVVSAVKPSYDVMLRAAQEIPEMSGMTPAQIAESVFDLARSEAHFRTDPINALIGLAQKHGQLDALRAVLSGGQVQQQFNPQQFLGTVQQQIPAIVQQHIDQAFQQRTNETIVTEFMATAEHWAAVQDDLPTFIPQAIKKLGEQGSPKDILARAYDMAIHADPDLRAKVRSASKAEPEPDPQKAAEAARAASINVSSRGATNSAPLTERQMLTQSYREAQRK